MADVLTTLGVTIGVQETARDLVVTLSEFGEFVEVTGRIDGKTFYLAKSAIVTISDHHGAVIERG